MSRIDELKRTRLAEMEQRYRTSERVAGQEFSAEQSQADRDFRAGESAADREQRLQLARMRESGANARASAGRNDWQLVPMQGGGYGRYNPRTNQFEEANIPEGVDLSGGSLSDRQKAQLDMLGDQAETLRKKMADGFELTAEERIRLGEIEGQMESIVNPSGSSGLADRLAGRLQGESPANAGGGEQGGDVPTMVRQEREQQASTAEQRDAVRAADQARDEADEVIEQLRSEQAGGASPGGLLSQVNRAAGRTGPGSDETRAEAQRVAEQLLQASRSPHISDDRKRWIAERIIQLQDLGVDINLDSQ
ncbi:hypothetical protein [Halomonas salifodinae]